MRGLRLGLGLGRNGGGGGISVSIGSGFVISGTELTATVNGLVGGETVTYQWTDDGVNITGATSSTYTVAIGTDSVADASAIRCVATVDGTPYTSNARTVAYAAGSFGALSNQSFADDTGDQTYVFDAATGANLTWTYALTSPPSGVTIVSATRTITFDTNALAIQSGTVITVTATDQYGRAATGSPRTFTLDIAEAPVLSAFGSGSIDDLEEDPPAIFIEHNIGGTLTGDFDTSATPPAKEGGSIGFFTTTLSGDAVTDISTALNTFLDLHPGQTGYLHFRLTNGTDSNVITTQQITTPTAFSLIDDGWEGFDATISDNVVTATVQAGSQTPMTRKDPYVFSGAGSWRITVDASPGTVDYLTIQTQNYPTASVFLDIFDLSAGTILLNNSNTTTAITSLGGGRYRCQSTVTLDGSDLSGRLIVGMSEFTTLHRVENPDGTETINIHNVVVEAV